MYVKLYVHFQCNRNKYHVISYCPKSVGHKKHIQFVSIAAIVRVPVNGPASQVFCKDGFVCRVFIDCLRNFA